MPTVISGDTGIDKVQDGSIGTADLANGAVTPGKLSQPLTLETAKATTSGTAIDFTGIPSWVKRITVLFNGVSTNGASLMLLQVGAGSLTTSGYLSNAWSNNTSTATSAAGFVLTGLNSATGLYSGTVSLVRPDATAVIESSVICSDVSNNAHLSGGRVVLGGTLDRLRLTTANGTDTFDAGSVNILYE